MNFSFFFQMTNNISEYQHFKGVHVFMPHSSFVLCWQLQDFFFIFLRSSAKSKLIPAAHLDSASFWYNCGGLLYFGFLSQTTNKLSKLTLMMDRPDEKKCSHKWLQLKNRSVTQESEGSEVALQQSMRMLVPCIDMKRHSHTSPPLELICYGSPSRVTAWIWLAVIQALVKARSTKKKGQNDVTLLY